MILTFFAGYAPAPPGIGELDTRLLIIGTPLHLCIKADMRYLLKQTGYENRDSERADLKMVSCRSVPKKR